MLLDISKDKFKIGVVEFMKLYCVILDNEKVKNIIVNSLKPEAKQNNLNIGNGFANGR